MSYLLYINGIKIDLKGSSDIALSKQVNTIGSISSRQTNFSKQFKVKKTEDNIQALGYLSIVGNNSNIPYQKNTCDLIDAESGEHLIYKGWANVNDSDENYFNINTYDGNIDFFKSLEGLSLTDVGLTGLDHLKNVTNVVASFNNSLPYKYIVADYNGRENGFSTYDIDIDFLVPSARHSFLWNKIFEFIGYTYTGSVFTTQKFLNWFMTYPKPVPTLSPIVELITNQDSAITTNVIQDPGGEYVTYYGNLLFPIGITSPIISSSGVVLQAGSFRITCSGFFQSPCATFNNINWYVQNSGGIVSSGIIDSSVNQSVIVSANIGDSIVIISPATGVTSSVASCQLSGSVNTKIELILGYDADFSASLINFKVTSYVKEVMQKFGLTAFKDKFTNNVDFKTLKELLETTDVIDWSDKNPIFVKESYVYGSYAKRNYFKYKYNDNNDSSNDSYIEIDNENLKEEITVVNSNIYSPEKYATEFFGQNEIYKIWEKEAQGDGSIKYKELKDRYYYIRSIDKIINGLVIGSTSLNQDQIVSTPIPYGSYVGLSFKEIIADNYSSMKSLLNKAKVATYKIYLNSKEYSDFTFKKLIYLEQSCSYYLVNKISNFTKNKYTNCELIEVDRFLQTDDVEPIDPFIFITGISIIDCTITLDVDTNYPNGTYVQLIPFSPIGGGFFGTDPLQIELPYPVFGIVNNGQVIFDVNFIPNIPAPPFNNVGFQLSHSTSPFTNIISNLFGYVPVLSTCYIPQTLPNTLTIDNYEVLSINTSPFGTFTNYRLTYSYDNLPVGTTMYAVRIWSYAFIGGWHSFDIIKTVGQNTVDHSFSSIIPTTQIKIQIFNTESNTITI